MQGLITQLNRGARHSCACSGLMMMAGILRIFVQITTISYLKHAVKKKCWKLHRQIDPHTKELIKILRANNVSMTKVYCILKSAFGNNSASPVTKGALRNLCGQLNKENAEEDVKKTGCFQPFVRRGSRICQCG